MMEEEKILPSYCLKQLKSQNKQCVIADYIALLSDWYTLSLYNKFYGRLPHLECCATV